MSNLSPQPRPVGHGLIQVGALLFLLALLVGLGVPRFAVPRLALSTHLLGITQGTFLMVVGLLWPRLALPPRASFLGRCFAIYGCVAAWTANLLGAIWGAGHEMVPLAAGVARGTFLQETVIRVMLMSAAVTLIVTAVLFLWGLTARASAPSDQGGPL